jgi:hypothetical protein
MIAAGFRPSASFGLIALQKEYFNGYPMKRLGCFLPFLLSISQKKEMQRSNCQQKTYQPSFKTMTHIMLRLEQQP